MTTFVKVQRHRRSVGRACMHCGKSATVTAIRKRNGMRLAVRYCDEHAQMRGAT